MFLAAAMPFPGVVFDVPEFSNPGSAMIVLPANEHCVAPGVFWYADELQWDGECDRRRGPIAQRVRCVGVDGCIRRQRVSCCILDLNPSTHQDQPLKAEPGWEHVVRVGRDIASAGTRLVVLIQSDCRERK